MMMRTAARRMPAQQESILIKFLKVGTAIATTLIALPVVAEGAPRAFPVAATPVFEDRFPVVPVAFPDGVMAYRDVVYQTNPGYRPQVVDVYVPAAPGPHPLVLYIHGGARMGGHTRHSGALSDFPKVLARSPRWRWAPPCVIPWPHFGDIKLFENAATRLAVVRDWRRAMESHD